MAEQKELVLFGGEKGWSAADWTSSDDTVRGGSSQSHLDISGLQAWFHGTLDIETLGGAGFASQRTTCDDRSWNLSHYDGIYLKLGQRDQKKYTFTLKDVIAQYNVTTGREQSSLSYEYSFNGSDPENIFVPWSNFKPTYRGKDQYNAGPLNTTSIKRFTIMIRSFFGEQQGNFSLHIESINAALQPTSTENFGIAEKVKRIETVNAESWPQRGQIFGAAIVVTVFVFWWTGLHNYRRKK